MITVTVELEDGNRNERLKEILALWNDQEESRYQDLDRLVFMLGFSTFL